MKIGDSTGAAPRFLLGFALFAFLAACASAQVRPETTVEGGRLAFSLPDLNGKTVSLDDARFKDKVVLIDVWGTWCGPCIMAIPYLNQFHERYQPYGLEIVGIAFEIGTDRERAETLNRFLADTPIGYQVLLGGSLEGDSVGKALPALKNFWAYPTVVYIGRDGRVRRVEVSFDPARLPETERLIRELLMETPEDAAKSAALPPKEGERPAPTVEGGRLEFRLPDLRSEGALTHADERLKDKAVIVAVWASWFGPSRKLMPHLARMGEAYRERGLEIVGIGIEREADAAARRATALEFAREQNIEFTLLDGGPVAPNNASVTKSLPALKNFSGFPTLIFIGRDGLVKRIRSGYGDGDEKEIEAWVAELLEGGE
jgi:thiol-disulfide isomerase/thioredoxin